MKRNLIIGLVLLILLSSFVSGLNLIDGQVLYYKFDGNTSDATPNNFDATNNGASLVTGKINLSYNFTPTDYIQSAGGLSLGNNYTFSLWAKADTVQTSVAIGSGSGTIEYPDLLFINDGSIQFGTNGVTARATTGAGFYSVDTWYHIVGIGSGDVLQIYVDGNLEQSVDLGTNALSDSTFRIGQRGDGTISFDGSIDEVAVWNRSLNQTEITFLYANGNPTSEQQYPYEILNFTITAIDNASSQPILNFTANVSGTIYNTLTGIIITTINDSQLVNITVSSNNYFNTTYLNYNTSNNLEVELNPETLEDFILITPDNSSTSDLTFNITYTEAISPTSKTVNYTINSYFPNGSLKESFSTLNLFYDLNITDYNSGLYTIEVNATENITDVSFKHNSTLKIDFQNYVYFNDANTLLPLINNSVTIAYPNSNTLSLTTDSNGKVNFSSFNSDILQIGVYNITFEGVLGYLTPITFSENITFSDTPFNITYNISRANLTILVKDTETNALVIANVTVSITGIGEFEIENGNLTLENQSFINATYTVYVSSDDYTFNQKDFTFTNQEELVVSIFVTNITTPNLGTILVTVYDSYLDIVSGGDLRLQILEPSSGSFIEEAQRTSSSSGQATFNVLINENSYRIQATATVGGVTYTGFSIDRGETFFEDGQIVNVYLNTVIDIDESQYEGLNVTVTNTTLVNNVSFHQVDFIDVNGLDHEVCLEYSFLNGIIKTSYLLNCTVGASGTIHEVGGNLLDRNFTWIVDSYVKEGNYKRYYYTETYKSSNNFGTIFQFIVKWLMASLLLIALAMAVHLDRIDYFVYLSIGLSILWLIVVPSYMSATMVGLTILLGLMVGDLAKNKSSVEGD